MNKTGYIQKCILKQLEEKEEIDPARLLAWMEGVLDNKGSRPDKLRSTVVLKWFIKALRDSGRYRDISPDDYIKWIGEIAEGFHYEKKPED